MRWLFFCSGRLTFQHSQDTLSSTFFKRARSSPVSRQKNEAKKDKMRQLSLELIAKPDAVRAVPCELCRAVSCDTNAVGGC